MVNWKVTLKIGKKFEIHSFKNEKKMQRTFPSFGPSHQPRHTPTPKLTLLGKEPWMSSAMCFGQLGR